MGEGEGDMADPVLKKDSEMHFPVVTVLKASAGSGKTRTLTERFVQFLLSEKIPRSGLRNVLAVTFSNNAAKEMKERILSWLKRLYFGEEREVAELSAIISLPAEMLASKAGLLIEDIIDNYADFQVKTIDSFMTGVFKASAIDFGYNPDFEILMSSDALMAYSFNLFLRDVREGSARAAQLMEIIHSLGGHKTAEAAFIWDPSSVLLQEIQKIYRRLAAAGKRLKIVDSGSEQRDIQERLIGIVEKIEQQISRSGLKRHGNSSYGDVLSLVRMEAFPDLIGKGFVNPPVTKPRAGSDAQATYDTIIGLWRQTEELVRRYAVLYASSCAAPYARAYEAFSRTVEMAKRQQGKVFIEDINLHLSEYLGSDIVPDVYFRIGETIFHYFIDEFQDTSPIQWRNLFPLVENSLSQGGSLFAVGDTKQAIYGFRNADYTIMKGLESANPFPSARHEVAELDLNYRSLRRVLEFSDKVFKEKVPRNSDYREAGEKSGLTGYVQKHCEKETEEGYAEVRLLERSSDDPAEKVSLHSIIGDLCSRGYRWGDIAVLTQRNEDAVRVTTWLNEKNIDFISYSSLDIRRRKITGELVALLNFLDSPTDDFSFGVFILGEVFGKTLARDRQETGTDRLREFCFHHRENPPLYTAFRREFGALWEEYFEGLFRATGFLPLYDLVTEVFAVFRVFEILPEEEAALVKVLEVVKDFEGLGFNSLKDFLGSASGQRDDGAEWDMAVPKNINAVKVMTVHKAKGLGFPIVIMLLYEVKSRGFEYIVREEEKEISLLKINRVMSGHSMELRELYCNEQLKDLVGRLNSLYVGFTRPQRELYVIGVRGRTVGYPFDLLPLEEFPPSAVRPVAVGWPVEVSETPASAALLHRFRPLEFPAGPERAMSVEEKRRGEFIHKVLSFIEYVSEDFEQTLEQTIRISVDETGFLAAAAEVKALIMSVIHHEKIAPYFRQLPDRWTGREVEYSDASGRLFRMDRVIVDRNEATVIDFKTGGRRDAEETHRQQMRDYLAVLKEVYPGKKLRGMIFYTATAELEEAV